MSRHGELTGIYGKKLYDYCQETYPNILTVYYDHGDKENDPNVVAAMGYHGQDGEKIRNRNRLTDVDILVVSHNEEIVLLIEVEQSTASPKNVLGDILATKMSNKFAVKIKKKKDDNTPDKKTHNDYKVTCQTSLFIAFPYKEGGDKKYQMEQIESRITEIGAFSDGVSSNNIRFIIGPNLDDVLEKLEKKVKKYLVTYTNTNKI